MKLMNQKLLLTGQLTDNSNIRYIGNKSHSAQQIIDEISKVSNEEDIIADLFSGTAIISQGLRLANRRIIANDILLHCNILAESKLLQNGEPKFNKIIDTLPKYPRTKTQTVEILPYDRVLSFLNSLSGIKGFFYKNYSVGGSSNLEYPRKYFTENNAKKIDAIRNQLKSWNQQKLLQSTERSLLLSDLFRATNRVANVAGTYGCYLKIWYDRALQPLQLQRSNIIKAGTQHKILNENANDLAKTINCSVAYIDPPYTKRQYAAYYHILETLANEDEPKLTGKTGLRSWKENASDYCYKRKASKSLTELVTDLNTPHIFVSYSEDGHISHNELMTILSSKGKPVFTEIKHSRFKSNNKGHKNKEIIERLYYVKTN